MAVIVVGINHRGASLDIRERIAYRSSEVADALTALREESSAREAVLLSTCNRTELYFVDGDADVAPVAWAALSARLGSDASGYGYVRRDREAVAHLFRVTSGLDSMVLGEAQIHGQVRDAWEACRAHSGPVLNRLFQTSLSVAGRVRNETSIARGAASVSSAAVQLAKQIFGALRGKRAMVLGAGDMAELALECLGDQGVRTSIVANRTYERATELAARYGAVAMHYDECWTALADVDVLVSSTAAPHAVVLVEHVRPALESRGDRPLCILDIALPRDVDPAVGDLANVFLYNLDDLQSVATANLERRRAELPTAEEMIEGEVGKYWDWLAGLAAVPVLTAMRDRMEEVRAKELADTMRRLRHLPPAERAVVEELSKTLMNKFLHEPTVRLRAAASNGRGLGVVDTVRYLFGLEPRAKPSNESASPARDRDA
ncbi:MAG TPA: glutamyl-tRNA reductase [Gemmatimonadaceae bacterium]|jgi:glutamyl-tRNA reductase|nr:glutamyl-tRNA reductase [Gemmatimonadaceae bacterium]